MSGLLTDRWVRGFSIFFFVFFFCLGCAQEKSRQDLPEGPGPDPSTGILPLYPHVLGWEDPSSHGAGFSQYGLDACLSCHQADITPSGGPLACKDCHTLFPHPDQWLDRSDPNHHGRYVIAHGSNSCATRCHGSHFDGGLSRVSCNSGNCHAVYPHSTIANWAGPAHGLMAVDLGNRNGCKDCHGADLLGGVSGISCKSCHTEFPHPGDWSAVQNISGLLHVSLHGQRFMEQKVAGFPATPNTCSSCHGADYEGGNSQKSCISCHPFYPHIKYEPNWKVMDLSAIPLGGQHGPAFLSGAHNFTSDCTQCHPRFGGGLDVLGLDASVQAPVCNSCHPSYPHLKIPDVPAADDWVRGTTSSYHGIKFVYETLLEGPTHPNSCKACHGNDLLGMGSAPKNCANCHEHFGSVSHEGCCQITSHPGAAWRQTSHHGNVYLNSLAEGNTFAGRCGKCHSSSLKRDPIVCNPYSSGDRDACNVCHRAPAVACSIALCTGMSAEGVCP